MAFINSAQIMTGIAQGGALRSFYGRMAVLRKSSNIGFMRRSRSGGLGEIDWGALITGAVKTGVDYRLNTLAADRAAAQARLEAANAAAQAAQQAQQAKLLAPQSSAQAVMRAVTSAPIIPLAIAALGAIILLRRK